MASASVVGQHPGPHRLDSEPQLLIFKVRGNKKRVTLPRRSSWERMMFRRSSASSGDSDSVAAEKESETHAFTPAAALEPAVKGEMMPGEGCVTQVVPAAPRTPERDTPAGCVDCDRRAGESGSEQLSGERNGSDDCDINENTSVQRVRTYSGVMPNGAVTNGHKAAQRRSTWSGENGHQSISSSCSCSCSSVPEQGDGVLPLERLTQGRTGVVRQARTKPPRREAWLIFPCRMDSRMKAERGEGHRFEAKPVAQDWCDACNRQITAQALKCQNCSYTCHLECERKVQLDCNQRDKEPEQTPSPRRQCNSTAPQPKPNEAKDEEHREVKELSEEEVRTRIKEYNSKVSEIGMKLASDGIFSGFIKVRLRLSRPVTVPTVEATGSDGTAAHSQAPSECQERADCALTDKKTSFYLPSDCVMQIHISSVTTTREVIQALLKKYMVLDNPCKFALYKQTHRDGQEFFQKLPLCEHPLLLRLIAGPDLEQLSFVLKESETEGLEWYGFSVPELQNFLVILEKEEAERVRAVEQKYAMYRQKLQQALQQHDP